MPLDSGDVVAGYSFQVEIDGVTLAQFKEVTGIASELQVIEHRENTKGGQLSISQLPGRQKNGTIGLKRGRTDDASLWKWHKQVVDGDIKGARKNGSIVLYDYAHGELSRWNFVAGWPSKVSLGSLQAQGNDVLI